MKHTRPFEVSSTICRLRRKPIPACNGKMKIMRVLGGGGVGGVGGAVEEKARLCNIEEVPAALSLSM